MIAGIATHASLAEQAHRPAFVMTEESFDAVQRKLTTEEWPVVEAHRAKYKAAIGNWPHGLHYISFPGAVETVAVWFPLP